MKLLISLCGLFCLAMALPPTSDQVKDAILAARQQTAHKREMELKARDHEATADPAPVCPMAMYHGTRKSKNVETDKKSNDMLRAAKILMGAGFTEEELRSENVVNEFRRQGNSKCPFEEIECEKSRFRSVDGLCNNLERPFVGSAGVPQIRMLPANYEDGISDPPFVSNEPGEFLPNARLVSNAVHRAGRRQANSDRINLHVFQMGQFLDHDIIATPIQGEVVDCCQAEDDIDNCMPIRIEGQDEFNENFVDGYCMNFARSAPEFCPTTGGGFQREQINAITSFIDASNVYGSSDEQLLTLVDGPFMATEEGNRLPNEPNNLGCIPDVDNGIFCSVAGDHRVNVVPSLNAYHTLWVREHNRIAEALRSSFSDDVELFQQTRRIVIAAMQKIIYNEFLPTFISERGMRRHELFSDEPYRYDPRIDPTVTNEFGIAYRMGHTWIPRRMDVFNQNFRRRAGDLTEFTYFNTTLTYFQGRRGLSGLDGLALWLTGENSTETDTIIENAARDFLFLDAANNSFDLAALNIQRGRDHGLQSYVAYRDLFIIIENAARDFLFLDAANNSFDLAALNIQRGRDHGLQSYVAYRDLCGLDEREITRFRNLPDHSRRLRRRLRSVYADVRDIDLFSGGLSEEPVEEGTVGPTFECILGRQFRDLKFGDRFWYQGDAVGFNREQLEAIEEYSMAKVLCNNYDFDTVNFPNAFTTTDEFIPCDEVPQLDLRPFSCGTNGPNGPTIVRPQDPTITGGAPARNLHDDLEALETLLEKLTNEKSNE